MHSHFHHFAQISTSGGSDSSFWGAFLGAFFAFIFGLIMFYFTKKRERFTIHKNALVKLERLLNEHADELIIAKQHADVTREILEKNALTDYRFKLLKVDEELSTQFASIDIINKYFVYCRSINRLNMDFSAKNHALGRFEDAKLAGATLAQESMEYLANSMGEISASIEKSIDTQMLTLLATTRIYLRKIKARNPIIYGIFCTNRDFAIPDEEIKAEIKKLDVEVEQVREQTREDIKKYGTNG